MYDLFQEIAETLRKNKMRTVLTGLSVSWGIFILIVLLGAGNGLKNGVTENFSERAVNRVTLWSGTTSMPYNGLKSGRNLQFSEKEIKALDTEVEESRLIAPRLDRSQTVSFGGEYGTYSIRGVMPGYSEIEMLEIAPGAGRFINDLDVKEMNKVIVLDQKIVNVLFKDQQQVIGNYVKVGNIMFKVVGINSKKVRWGTPAAYIPFSTGQLIFNPSKKINNISFTVDGLTTKEENDRFNQSLREVMGRHLNFNPDDRQALWINNAQEDYIETQKIFGAITMFVSIIGILTLIAGIVGVSNIMLVSVKERTREIGIRKAIGAPPWTILRTVIVEALIITSIFGYIGILTGIGLTELVNFIMEQSANGVAATDEVQMSVFKNPTVNINYVLFATAILIAAGVLAGYLPARKAVKIKPIEAMRQE